jgi:hypothetical protein
MTTPSVNQRIAESIRAYPTLFGCRTDVLHYWFCVIGNGTEWEDGELRGEPLRELSVDEKIQEGTSWIQSRLDDAHTQARPELMARYRMLMLEAAQQIRFRMENAADLALVPWGTLQTSPRQSIYGLCDYSRLSTVPDDVKPAWLDAVREMIMEVFSSEPRADHHRGFTDPAQQTHDQNLEFADQCLQSLAQRFGPGTYPGSLAEWHSRRNATLEELKQMLQQTSGE